MEKKINTFKVVTSGIVYAFLKEKYKDDNINPKDKEKNIIQIYNQLIKIESFGAIPDKKKIIEEKYDEIKSLILNKELSETKLLEYMHNASKDLSGDDREKILDSIIYIILIDKKISDIEKNIILQMIEFLNLKLSYKEALQRYNNSEFKKPPSVIIVVVLGVLLLSLVIGALFWQYKKESNIKVFNSNNEIVFNEVYFNKYVIYKNKFSNLSNKYFLKQAIFYLSGKADISFNPKNLTYDRVAKQITYTYPKDIMFQSKVIFNPVLLVDKIDPKPLTANDAKKISAVIGIAGGIAGGVIGAKLGSALGKFLPPQYKFAGLISAAVGGIAGGVTGGLVSYHFAFKALNGLHFSELTEKEENSVKEISKDIIKAQIALDKNLQSIYKRNFEKFIKLQYGKYGLNIKSIVYKEQK